MKLTAFPIAAALTLSFVGPSAYCKGGNAPGVNRPYPTEPLKSAGEVFSLASDSRINVERSKFEAQSAANKKCQSGKAVRVSNWKVTTGTVRFPGRCVEESGTDYCETDTEIEAYLVSATFRCR